MYKNGGCGKDHFITVHCDIIIMAVFRKTLFLFLVLGYFFLDFKVAESKEFKRRDFPDDFVFGASTAAYQFEGAAQEGGRGPSIWDTYVHQFPDRINDHSSGDVADDFYHRYKDDIALLKDLGMDVLRMSISWSRILPQGKLSKGVNEEGVKFYNNVFNELIKNGIKPFVTLFHWDVPQALEDEYNGFLSHNIVNDYRDYVNLCFQKFGDRVKHWITLNEPYAFATTGYGTGEAAPCRCSNVTQCTQGNSQTEPYIVGHNLLLAHAAAVQVYKTKYQASQKGVIGITNIVHWFMPQNQTKDEIKNVENVMDYMLGWFVHPLVYGDYPQSMKASMSNGLPKLSHMQSKLLKGSLDFLGINYYAGSYPVTTTGKVATHDIVFEYPEGIRKLVLYIKKKYKNPVIYITENGHAQFYNSTTTSEDARNDVERVKFFQDHLSQLLQAIKEGANVKGHMAWSFLDDFEWGMGYIINFGLVYVDRNDGLKRYPKQSALWYKKFLGKK